MGYHEWLLLNEALQIDHPVFVINLANRSGIPCVTAAEIPGKIAEVLGALE